MLASLPDGYRALVFGAGGGIGGALCARLAADGRAGAVYASSRRAGPSAGRLRALSCDITDEASIAAAAAEAGAAGPIDLVIVATGVLQAEGLRPERTWAAIDGAALARAYQINAIGPALIAKHTLGLLPRQGKAVFAALSARVASLGDNRLGGWHAYRASKAALNMLVCNFAIELARRNPAAVAVALHPGTVDTALSRPFQGNVAADKLFSAVRSADYLLAVIDGLGAADSGGLFGWDGARIPF